MEVDFMYYENFETLCKINNAKPSDVSKATGIHTATFTSWKQGKYTPKQDKLQLIAEYFNVSVDYLMTGKEPEYNTEIANRDIALTNMSERLKAYALKMAELSEENQEFIMKMIDKLEESMVK